MKNSPTVDIVTVTYNSAVHLEKCLKSVQLSRPFVNNYIIIDGGSTDATLSLLTKYSDIITTIISEKDAGISDAFNKGISLCTSNFILLLNSDDWLIEGALGIVRSSLQHSDQIVCTEMLSYVNDKCIGRFSSSSDSMRRFNSILHPGCLVPRFVYQSVGAYDTSLKLAMDYDFFARCVNSAVKFRFVSFPLVAFREGGVSRRRKYLILKESFSIRKKHFKAKFPWSELLRLITREIGDLLEMVGIKSLIKRLIK
jgi:glycosyltransferase involved in cell wall biosynthesis